MKPTLQSIIERRLGRHDHRAGSRRAYPVTDCYFQPEPNTTLRYTQPRGDDPARRAFRKMTVEMLASQNQHEALEMLVFAFVAALTAWPLVSLVILLAQTANN